jgi:HK97 family phage portal protein
MGIFSWLRPKAATQSATGGRSVTTPEDLERAIRVAMAGTTSGVAVTQDSAMKVGAVFACVRLISGAIGNMPLSVIERVDEKTRREVRDHHLWPLLRETPNRWQTAAQFKRMMTALKLTRGNAYALKVFDGRGRVIELLPLDPDRMQVEQLDDMSLVYTYSRKTGGQVRFAQTEIMHLMGLSFDGIRGVSVIAYAREAIGLSLAQDQHGAKSFKNAARPSVVLEHPQKLSTEALEHLRQSANEFRSGGELEGQTMVLEEGMKLNAFSLSPEDMQWIESRKMSRTDIAMFFGVPPHMIGDTDKATSWGSGIEQQSIGFVTYTLEDHFTDWEQTVKRDLVPQRERDVVARFNRRALLRGDLKARKDYYQSALQWGWLSPNDVRALEDMNPRDGGDVYYPPPNMSSPPDGTGGQTGEG